MKKCLVVFFLALLAACNSGTDTAKVESMKSDTSSAMTPMADIKSPYSFTYSSKFEMGDPKNVEAILTLWKDWDNGTLDAHKEIFSDSVQMYFADGTSMKGPRDSIVAAAQAYRSTIASATSTVHAAMPSKSIDKNENWALIWGSETDKWKNGKTDSFNLQETWRFDKNGKADLMYQFRSEMAPKKK